MIREAATPPDPLALSGADLLALAQNPMTPLKALEQILAHPALSPEVVEALLHHPATPGAVMAALAQQASGPILVVLLASLARLGRWAEVLEALLRNPAVPTVMFPAIQTQIEATRRREVEGTRKGLLLRIKDLPVGERLALAKKGNKDVRMILIKDINETVATEVVASPRITEEEILAIAQMRDISDKVLRHIASNRRYRQNHQILVALLNNPRTPVGVSLGLGIHLLSDRELSHLAKSRDVPGAVSRAARQVLNRRKGEDAPKSGRR
jgi:hypothetical protein